MLESPFMWLVLLVLAIVPVNGHIYHRHILETLDEPAAFSPIRQFSQYDRYVAVMDERGLKPWFLPFVRHQRLISAVFLLLLAGSIFFETQM